MIRGFRITGLGDRRVQGLGFRVEGSWGLEIVGFGLSV